MERESESHHVHNSAVYLPNTHSHEETVTLYNDLSGLKEKATYRELLIQKQLKRSKYFQSPTLRAVKCIVTTSS